MKSIYTMVKEPVIEPLNISMEMIDFQLNDKAFLLELEELCQDIINVVKEKNLTIEDFNTGEGNDYNKKLVYLLSNRFGMQFTMTKNSEKILAACLPVVSSTEYNTLQQQFGEDILSEINYYIKHPNVSVDQKKALSILVNSMKSLNNAFGTKGILVDFKKAKILGLPEDCKSVLWFDFPSIVNKYNLTAKEMAAIILHEVGHCFTHIACSYKDVVNTTNLVDTFLENINNKNKSPKESLILACSDALKDKEILKYKDKDGVFVSTVILNKVYHLSKQNYAYTDSEQQADQFSVRFGYGKELASGLNKLKIEMDKDAAKFVVISASLLALSIALCILCLNVGGILTLLAECIVMFSVTLGLNVLSIISSFLFPGQSVMYGNTYDEDAQRFRRMALEMIKALRTLDLDKKTKKLYIDNVEYTLNIANKYKRNNVGPIEWVMRLIRSDMLEIREIQKATEMLMDNNLHLASAKLSVTKI